MMNLQYQYQSYTSKVIIDFWIIGNKEILIMIGMIGDDRFYSSTDQ